MGRIGLAWANVLTTARLWTTRKHKLEVIIPPWAESPTVHDQHILGELLTWSGVMLAAGMESKRSKARSHSSPELSQGYTHSLVYHRIPIICAPSGGMPHFERHLCGWSMDMDMRWHIYIYICVWCLFSVGRYPSDPNVSLLPSGRRPTFSSRGARCVALQEAPFSCVWTWGAPVPGILANCQLNGEYNIIQRLIMVKLASQWMRCILGPTHLLQRFKPWGSPMKQLSLLHMLWWQHSRQKPWSHLAATQRIAGKPRRLRHSNETGPATYLWIGFQEDHKKVLVSIPGYILYILQLYSNLPFQFGQNMAKPWWFYHAELFRATLGSLESSELRSSWSANIHWPQRAAAATTAPNMKPNVWEHLRTWRNMCAIIHMYIYMYVYIYIYVCVCDKRYIYNIIYI